MDTSDCTYCCNRTSPPMSQSNKRKATPREVKKPLATVPPPAIYVLSKNSPCSLNIQVKLTSLTLLTSISMSVLLDSGATGMFINWSFVQKHQLETTPLPHPSSCTMSTAPQMRMDQSLKKSISPSTSDVTLKGHILQLQTLDNRQ